MLSGKTRSKSLLKAGRKCPMPETVSPMLCTLVRQMISDPEYVYEVKWDGYRIIASVKKGKVALTSRGGLNYTEKYAPVVEALQKLDFDVVLDGEVITLNSAGLPDFDALQKNTGEYPMVFYVFDIIWCNGYDLTQLPLIERKNILSQVIPFDDVLKYSDHFEDGTSLFELMKEQQMEGIVIKKKDSKYQRGARNRDWLKLPTEQRQEFVIGGWTESDSGTHLLPCSLGITKKASLSTRDTQVAVIRKNKNVIYLSNCRSWK